MKLVVEIMTGPLLHIQVDDKATVADLKKEIRNHENVPSGRFMLVRSAENQVRLMEEDGGSLVEYGVRDGSHVQLCFAPIEDDEEYEGFNHQIFFTIPDSLFLYGP
ncbi:hypothetical protein ACHQM5_003701 [Ranunculus cassubicifolius]